METFETTLTGSDGLVDGVVTVTPHPSFGEVYQFNSLDDMLTLVIAKDYTGKWIRVSGSEPYFSGWVDELADHIEHPSPTASSADETILDDPSNSVE